MRPFLSFLQKAGSGGGFIEFHFDNPADILHVEMLDTDESNTPDIHFYKPGGSRYTLDTPATGDNGLFYKDLAGNEYRGIDKVSFEYYGSGSVSSKFFRNYDQADDMGTKQQVNDRC